jgi:hypothetical protein
MNRKLDIVFGLMNLAIFGVLAYQAGWKSDAFARGILAAYAFKGALDNLLPERRRG